MQDSIYAILRSALEDMRILRRYEDPVKTDHQITQAVAYLQAQHAASQPVPRRVVAETDGWYWFRGIYFPGVGAHHVDQPVFVLRGTVQHAGLELGVAHYDGEFWLLAVPYE